MQTRKKLRLSGYDYSKPNAFFVTICCDRRRHLFGHIANGVMQRNPNGQFAHDQWLALADTYPHITLGEFVIMPNHMHGVIYIGEWDDGQNELNLVDTGELAVEGKPIPCQPKGGGEPIPCQPDSNNSVREGLAPSLRLAPSHNRPSLSAIIGAYKSLTYRDCLNLAKTNNERLGKLWHRSYHEKIIRTPEAARRIRHYIRNNVRAWARDKFYGG